MKKITLTLLICMTGWLSVNAQCADFNISADPVCIGSPVTFTDVSCCGSAPFTWNWNFGAGASPATFVGQTPPAVTYSSSGTKNITLTYTSSAPGACSDFRIYTLDVQTPPVASFTSTAPDCINSNIDFFNTGSSGGGVTYSWNFGAGASPATSTNQNPSGINYASSGLKTITFTITSPVCGSVSTFDTINIYDPADASFTTSTPIGCVGQGANFYHNGSIVALVHSWNFGSGATPATSTLANPTGIVYSTSGAKVITHDVNNGPVGCAQDNTTQVITINPAPTASFSSNAPQCTGSLVNFTNTGTTGAGVTYAWDFGLGATPATSTAQNPTGIMFSTSGTKTVTLNVTNQFGCVISATQTITIDPTPVASFTSVTPACTADSVNFLNTGTTGATYAWNFGSGATPATSTTFSQNNVVYSTAGIKTVILITTLGTCTATSTQTIDIKQTPAPVFTSNAPKCEGSAVTINYTGTTGLGWTYNWDFGTGASPAASSAQMPGNILYTGAGTKTITLTVSNDICSKTITGNVTINPTPVAGFTSTTPACTADSVNFLNTGTTGATYAWNFGSGATPATSTTFSQNNVVYSTAGIKTVMLITTLGTCTDTSTQTIDIKQTPVPAFTTNAPKCEGSAVFVNYTGTTGLGWTYNWDFGTGASPAASSAQMPGSIMYTGAGTKTITLTVNNDICSKTITGIITIDPTPVASFTSTTPACTADSVNFLNTGTTGATYAWNFGSGATPATSTTFSQNNVVYSTLGIKTVMLITTLGACTDTSTQTIDIKQTPAPAFTSTSPQCQEEPVSFNYTGTIGLGWTYSWDFGTGASSATSGAQTPGSVVYSISGTKTITLTVTNDICSKTITGTVVINPLPLANAGKDTVICNNTSVQIGSASVTGYTYLWFPAGTLSNATISNPVSSPIAPVTVYIVTVTNTATGCKTTDSVAVTMLAPLVALAGADGEICRFDSIQIGTGLITGQNYVWSPIAGLSSTTSPNPVASPAVTTTYTISVTGPGCGPVTDEVTIIVHPLPDANAGMDDTIMVGSSTQLIATGGVQYFWLPGTGLDNANLFNPIASPDSTINYVVTVTDLFGCVNTDTVTVVVYYYEKPFWLPTAFTPDADGHNDVLFVRGKAFQSFEFSVFNRTGDMVFYTKDMNKGWDGRKMSGEDMPLGAYIYNIKGTLEDGTAVSVSDMVNLIR